MSSISNDSESDSNVQLGEQDSIITLNEQEKNEITFPTKFKPNPNTSELVKRIRLVNTNKQNNETTDDAEEIDDGDIRYLMACKQAVQMFRNFESSQMKAGYEGYDWVISMTENLKFVILIFVILIMFFSKPEWCALTKFVTEDCSMNINPESNDNYILGEFPIIIDFQEKNFLLLFLGFLLQFNNLAKISFCKSSDIEKASFIACLFINVFQFIFYFLLTFQLIEFRIMDILSILMILFGVPKLQAIMSNFISVLYRSREILIFFLLFIFIFSTLSLVLFVDFPDFCNNKDIGSFADYNFKRFSNSFYSVSIGILEGSNFIDVIAFIQPFFKIGVFFYMIFHFFTKFFLNNLLIGLMYTNYLNTFTDDALYIAKNYKKLGNSIKRQIMQKKLSPKNLTELVRISFVKGHLDQDIYKVDLFYSEAQEQKKVQNSNKLSYKYFFSQLMETKSYKIFIGILDIIKLLGVIIATELDFDFGIFYIMIFFCCESLIKLVITDFKKTSSNYVCVFTIISTMIIAGCFMILKCFPKGEILDNFQHLNINFERFFYLLVVANSFNSLRLLFFNKLIAVIVDVINKSFTYIKDILSIIMTVILLYASIGMIIFGGFVTFSTIKKSGGAISENNLKFNFNDLYSSCFTLLAVTFSGFMNIAAINNNFDTKIVYFSYHLFFVSYFILITMCFLNIINGFLIDNCQSYLSEILGKELKLNLINKLKKFEKEKNEMHEKADLSEYYGNIREDLINDEIN